MFPATTFIVAASVGLVIAHPFSSPRREVTLFPAGSSWDILLSTGGNIGNVKQVVNDNFEIIDIDLFDTPKETITELKQTKRVICYFSAGSREGWRSDAGKFATADTAGAIKGGPDGDWPDELWVDVTSENVKSIMKARIEKAAQAGCDAIDPDNVDGFDNETGFNHPKSAYVDYVKYMAEIAKQNNLAIGLKNAVDLIPDVVNSVDFAVNEQCHEYSGECAKYKPFTDQNKAVFNIEYGGTACESPAGVKLSTLIKSEDQGLNALGGACPGQGSGTPTTGKSPQSSTRPSATVPTSTSSATATSSPTKAAPQPVPTNSSPDGEEVPDQDDEDDDDEDEDEPPAPSYTGRPGRTFGSGWSWLWNTHRGGRTN